MNYEILKEQTNTGWNTWNTSNVLSHVLLPYGFSINLCIKDHSRSDVFRELQVGRYGENEEHLFPGIRSYDGSYTEMQVNIGETELIVQSTAQNDAQYILVTPKSNGRKPTTLIVEACLLWGKEGILGKKYGNLFGEFEDGTYVEIFCSKEKTNYPHSYSLSPSFSVELTEPVCISTVPCEVSEVIEMLETEKEKLQKSAEKYGKHAESYIAMSSCLAWDTIYEPEHDRICSPVSRIWNISWGGYVLFDWDTYFASMMASLDQPELACLNAVAVTHEMTEAGFVPNFGSADDFKSRDRSQPPVGSMAILEIYKRYKTDWLVKEVYPYFIRWNRWFDENRSTDDGYLCWGSNEFEPVNGQYWECNHTGDRAGAALESGLDNSPMYDDAGFDPDREIMLLADVGLMGLYIKDCKSLIELAKIAGEEQDIPELEYRLKRTEDALMTLWNEEDGIFQNRDLATGKLSDRISPTNFYALYSEHVTEAQKKAMLENYFYNPKHFWGDYIMPSISRSDPGYPDQTYWRGRIWAPMNLLVYLAMKDAGLTADAKVLAEKSEELLLKEWRAHGHVHENYSGDDGWGCGVNNSDKFYHWGGLLGYIAIDADGL